MKASSRSRFTRLSLPLTAAVVGLSLSACAAPAAEEVDIQATVDILLTADAPTATSAATAAPLPSETPQPALSFEPETYRDPSAGFEFDYPANWTVGPVEQQSRGGITAFTSWPRPTDVLPGETPAGETRMDATVQLWDPTGDLQAFLRQRRNAWDASGTAVISEEPLTLEDGRPALAFVVQGSDGAQGFFFLTTIGEKYLVLSGDGNLRLLAEIARTVRPIEITY